MPKELGKMAITKELELATHAAEKLMLQLKESKIWDKLDAFWFVSGNYVVTKGNNDIIICDGTSENEIARVSGPFI
jgi:hypothetical protein